MDVEAVVNFVGQGVSSRTSAARLYGEDGPRILGSRHGALLLYRSDILRKI